METATATLSLAEIRDRLRAFDFAGLFNELGWDHLRVERTVEADGVAYVLHGVAQKRGFQVFRCEPGPDGAISDRSVRRRLDRAVNDLAREHLLIFADAANLTQVWQWVRREPGKPLQPHEHELRRGQTGEALAQRLQRLYVSLEEDEALTVSDVAGRVSRGLGAAERVTRRFYEGFRREHEAFRAFVAGIHAQGDRDWYASLMLNRLMFVYFIQKKGFLDGDPDYLRHKLAVVQVERGGGQFLSFYQRFLLRLFHQGLSMQEAERPRDLDALIGRVPYLNGGLFDVHELERAHPGIDIPDEAFERLFDFFDAYRWHLDERPVRRDNEINPDVLGYIFEKYVNQKQMGAYYTKEDITEYIGKNTIVPALFDMARKDVPIAFEPDGTLWRLLREDPDRYIYPAVRKGTELPLPAEIAAGLDDVTKRGGWNRPADLDHALPTETWREHVARRRRYEEVWLKLAEGEVTTVDDLITLNLDIRQFAQDAIAECEGPETLRAFWRAIERISILDPTCGSGAFLFAALNILQPLAEGCLDRMQAFVDELDRSEEPHRPEKFRDFRATLARVATHPSRDYFVLKQIVLGNLYGVDIMEEAVEICKLRLFLKLVAQVETPEQVEPLPDIDFNIRAGNTLVGFVSLAEVERALTWAKAGQLRMIEAAAQAELDRMTEEAEKAKMAFAHFREVQDEGTDAAGQRAAKTEVRERLAALRGELDRLQARTYNVDPHGADYADWRARHQPFHWLTEFYDIMHYRGGFDVIVGNPPYLEVSKLNGTYRPLALHSERCRDIYAWVVERSLALRSASGLIGFIVPVSIASSGSFAPLRQAIFDTRPVMWASHYANRPSQLFMGAQNRLTIIILRPGQKTSQIFSTRYHRWEGGDSRDQLLSVIEYVSLNSLKNLFHCLIPKIGAVNGVSILNKVDAESSLGENSITTPGVAIFWVRVPGYFCQFFLQPPKARPENGGPERVRGEVNVVLFQSEQDSSIAHALLNSSTYLHFYNAYTDGRHINPSDVREYPLEMASMKLSIGEDLHGLSGRLHECMSTHTRAWRKSGLLIDSADSKPCKPIIDEIDRVLATHYGFTDEELDFIINIDIKYRMGRDGENGGT